MFFIHFNDDILLYNLLYNGSYIHKSIKNFEFWIDFFNSTNFSIKQFLGLFQSNDFLQQDMPWFGLQQYKKILQFPTRPSKGVDTVPYRPVRPVYSLPELKTIQKHMCFILVQIPVIPGCSSYTGRNIML